MTLPRRWAQPKARPGPKVSSRLFTWVTDMPETPPPMDNEQRLSDGEILRWLKSIDRKLEQYITLDRYNVDQQNFANHLIEIKADIAEHDKRLGVLWDWMTSFKGSGQLLRWAIPVLALIEVYQVLHDHHLV